MHPSTIKLLWSADPVAAFEQVLARVGAQKLPKALLDAGVLPIHEGKIDIESLQLQLSTDDQMAGIRRIGILIADPANS